MDREQLTKLYNSTQTFTLRYDEVVQLQRYNTTLMERDARDMRRSTQDGGQYKDDEYYQYRYNYFERLLLKHTTAANEYSQWLNAIINDVMEISNE